MNGSLRTYGIFEYIKAYIVYDIHMIIYDIYIIYYNYTYNIQCTLYVNVYKLSTEKHNYNIKITG